MKPVQALFLIPFLFVGSTFAQDRPIHEIHTMMVFNFTK